MGFKLIIDNRVTPNYKITIFSIQLIWIIKCRRNDAKQRCSHLRRLIFFSNNNDVYIFFVWYTDILIHSQLFYFRRRWHRNCMKVDKYWKNPYCPLCLALGFWMKIKFSSGNALNHDAKWKIYNLGLISLSVIVCFGEETFF